VLFSKSLEIELAHVGSKEIAKPRFECRLG